MRRELDTDCQMLPGTAAAVIAASASAAAADCAARSRCLPRHTLRKPREPLAQPLLLPQSGTINAGSAGSAADVITRQEWRGE